MTVLVQVRFGAHLYGTATSLSDRDFKAVHLPSARDIVLQRVAPSVTNNTKTDRLARNTSADQDHESWALHKFFALVAEGNVAALDVLFAPSWAWTRSNGMWDVIVANRRSFVSRRCATFVGYCRDQANKYGIKGSRLAAAEKAVLCLSGLLEAHPGARLGDVSGLLEFTMGGTTHVAFPDVTPPNGAAPIRHLEVCGKRAPYTASIKLALDIYRRLYERSGARARAAKSNEGVDWKALSHAVRVGHQALELLRTGTITFPRPEARRLVMIKTGQVPFQDVALEVEALLEEVERVAPGSRLPEQPDAEFMESLVVAAYGSTVKDGV